MYLNFRWKFGFKIIDTNVNARQRRRRWLNKINTIRYEIRLHSFKSYSLENIYACIHFLHSLEILWKPQLFRVPVILPKNRNHIKWNKIQLNAIECVLLLCIESYKFLNHNLFLRFLHSQPVHLDVLPYPY